jgi:hypothetical protein
MAAPQYIQSGTLNTNGTTSQVSITGLGSDSNAIVATSTIVGEDLKVKVVNTLTTGDGEIVVQLFYTEEDLPVAP